MTEKFDEDSLPAAIQKLLELNNYTVRGPMQINGAEIDLVATPLSQAFSPTLYIEATIQYVDQVKFGKDATKFLLVQNSIKNAVCLSVTSSGYTKAMKERAEAADVNLLTYGELFTQFEKFEPYVNHVLGTGEVAKNLKALANVYQPPEFSDAHGVSPALVWMEDWLTGGAGGNSARGNPEQSWLIVVGEYGTGKSALTRMLQREWTESYLLDPSRPVPIRIELGDFKKQFDAQGLLHHFLDSNALSHVPIEFFWTLIRQGRVVLLLDGYDEMAQYLNKRERRNTLQALAQLSSEGARGLLTSRPNYFSEAEEFQVYEQLYREIDIKSEFLKKNVEKLVADEKSIDEAIERSLLGRFERGLKDLTVDQTQALVDKTLSKNVAAARTVNQILSTVFRRTDEGAVVSLSGKPVIVNYLVDVAEELSRDDRREYSEWAIYELILDKLGIRDAAHTSRVNYSARRSFLRAMALELSTSKESVISEEAFRQMVEVQFKAELRRYSGSQQSDEISSLFEDLRRSATLTRSETGEAGWKFSHNSIREFLVAESMVEDIRGIKPLTSKPPITDAMRYFVTSRQDDIAEVTKRLADAWRDPITNGAVGTYVSLYWDRLVNEVGRGIAISGIAGSPIRAQGVQVEGVILSQEADPLLARGCSFRDSTVSGVSFDFADMPDSDFSNSIIDGSTFRGSNLAGSNFSGSLVMEVSFEGAVLEGVNFESVDPDLSFSVMVRGELVRLSGMEALGYLESCGARAGGVEPYYRWMHHEDFSIVEKIVSKLLVKSVSQKRGLAQRGASSRNRGFAENLLNELIRAGYIEHSSGRTDFVSLTPNGRSALGPLTADRRLTEGLEDVLERATS